MKKLLLSVAVAALLFGCSSKDTAPEGATDADMANLQDTLASYSGACADVAFTDARAKMDEVNRLKAANQPTDAANAFLTAKDSYEQGLVKYNDSANAIDKLNAEQADQKSRIGYIQKDASKYASKEYADGKTRIDGYHASAVTKLAACDVEGATADMNEAEKELRYVEDLVAIRMNAQVVPMSTAGATYTVKKGDSLWKIAASKYSNPYFWPLIYWTNKASIKDPDLIYPNQKLQIDNNASAKQKQDAEKLAKTRGPWSLYDNK